MEHEEARWKEKKWKKTEAARLLFSASYLPCCCTLVGAKDAQDLKRYEKEHGVLGVNLGSGLSAGGGLTLHQELIMTMPGTGELTVASAAKYSTSPLIRNRLKKIH